MKYCKVVAIMNITDYNVLHVPIQKLDVPGVTVSMVKGFGRKP
jgi:nitrogen regulatory protein PII